MKMNYNLNGANYLQSVEFQNYVVRKLKEYGYTITLYNTKEEQYNIGESVEGYEIKNDKKLKRTGNLYIEVSEKTNPNNRNYYSSGIYRQDNTKFYIIGNEDVVYIFDKEYLKELIKNCSSVETLTSRGKLLPVSTLEENDKLTIIDFSIDPFWYKK